MVAQPDPEDLLPEGRYTVALERQLEALRMMRTQKPFNTVAHHVARQRTIHTGAPVAPKDDLGMDAAIAEGLARATPYFWGEPMNRVLLALEDDPAALGRRVLRAGDLPDEHGYLWFEAPLRIAPGDEEAVRALLWQPVAHDREIGYLVTVFTGFPAGHHLGLPGADGATGVPRTPLHWKAGESLTEFLDQIDVQYTEPGFRASVQAVSGLPADQHRRQLQRFAGFFAAAVEVLGQRLTRIAGARGDRAARRRLRALLGTPDVPLTRVVLLRPIDYVAPGEAPEPGDPVVWNHRWSVRRHRRRQRYGPGGGQVRTIWIESHVKGPAGLPLVARQPIKAVVR